jgi:hypothetical protein
MTRKKTKVAKYIVSLNEAQNEALKKLMADDLQENVNHYFGMMISEVVKGRESRRRGAVGRPRKVEGESEDEEEGGEKKWYPCPYDENAPPYTMDDLKAYYEFRGMPVPPQGPPLTKGQLRKWDM